MTTALPEPGDRIGNYRLLREIGRGAMGVVYEAEPLHPDARFGAGTTVALKLLVFPPLLPADERDALIFRFAREARALASIRHPSVVRVYEVDQVEGQPYLVMEFLAGLNAREWLLRHGPMPPAAVIHLGLQLCDALHAVHSAGIIHRDVKPDNVVIQSDETIRLTDFGIARMEVEASLTRTGGLIGSPAYMAPEHILGGRVDFRADLFSAGVTLLQMLTGELPFQGASLMEVAHRVAYEPPRSMTGAPGLLADTLRVALAKDPDSRYASALVFREALSRCLPDGSGEAAPSADLMPADFTPPAARMDSIAPVGAISFPASVGRPSPSLSCSFHAQREAVAHCADCEAPICSLCAHHRRGQIWCPDHALPRSRPGWVTRLEVLAIGLLFALLLWSLYPIHW